MRALVIADSGSAMADLTLSLVALKRFELRHANGRTQVTALARGFAPDLVLIDQMQWPPLALERISEVRSAAPGAAIVVLAERFEGAWIAEAMRRGAATVMPAGADDTAFLQVIDEVLTTHVPAAA